MMIELRTINIVVTRRCLAGIILMYVLCQSNTSLIFRWGKMMVKFMLYLVYTKKLGIQPNLLCSVVPFNGTSQKSTFFSVMAASLCSFMLKYWSLFSF